MPTTRIYAHETDVFPTYADALHNRLWFFQCEMVSAPRRLANHYVLLARYRLLETSRHSLSSLRRFKARLVPICGFFLIALPLPIPTRS